MKAVALVLTAILLVTGVGRAIAQPMSAASMSDDRFWELIDHTSAYESSPSQQMAALRSELDQLAPREIAAFDEAFDRQVKRAYRWDVWGAADLADGGASDDGFLYFRIWLISKGRRVFEAVLAHPDDLADLPLAPGPDGALEFEAFGYVAREALAAKQGGESSGLPGDDTFGPAPAGVQFKDDASSLAAAYPKLWKRFGPLPPNDN